MHHLDYVAMNSLINQRVAELHRDWQEGNRTQTGGWKRLMEAIFGRRTDLAMRPSITP